MTDKKRKTDAAWKQKNIKTVACRLYRTDAEAFEIFCKENGKSVNSALREYVAQCIGRPLERRTESKSEDE